MKRKIAVLCCGWSTYFVKDFIQGMQKAAKDKDTDIYIFNAYNFTEFSGYPNFTGYSVFSLINYEDYDGIVVLSDLINNVRVLEKERQRILKSGKPAITINKRLEGISCIHIDNYSGEYSMIEHLIRMHNATDFGLVRGNESSVDIVERINAFRDVLSANNLKLDPNKIFVVELSDYHSAYNYFSDYVKKGNKFPQVMVCVNDLLALAIIKVAVENKINVPDDLKILGFDDIAYSKALDPSLTTVKGNAELVGCEAVNRILAGKDDQVHMLKINSSPVYRRSCGCMPGLISDQKIFTLNVLTDTHKREEFNTQMERIGEIFTEAADVFTLLTNLELFFNKSHTFEGDNFCIFLKSDWSSVFVNSMENLPQNLTYGPQVQSIVSIQNNVKYPREMIPTRELIPSKMISPGSNVYLICPIFNHSYVHGYYVTKNNLALIDEHYAYVWTRTFGKSIEDFRKKNMYKQISQQYLKLSTRDALSGMLNRVGLEKLAKPFYEQNKRNGLTSVLFFVDINKMKHINDQFGHLHGDLAVKTISAAVMEVVPKNWLCIRYGGDEFLVVGNSKNYNGEDYCQMITDRITKKTSVMKLPYNLSASVGTYSVPPNSPLTLEQAVEKVDDIMYVKKQEFHKND